MQIASWLHDCGKVTTPEYVVDKATKLETIYDRIHEVRMRFEVLKRDAEIACWKFDRRRRDRAKPRSPRCARRTRRSTRSSASSPTATWAASSSTPAKIERLRTIACRTWLRTLDDRIGLSHEELQRKARDPAAALPAAETLLADKPEHVIERAPGETLPADNPWGFRLQTPALKYNRGELHNLAIARGTLTEEERYVINHHIVQTIMMLSQLPFPRHLRERAGDRRRPPRKDGRHRLPARPRPRRHEPGRRG